MILWLLVACAPVRGDETMRLRVAWGGGAERLWQGNIRLSEGTLADPRPLGIEADEPNSMWIAGGSLAIASRSARAYDGVDLSVDAPLTARLLVTLSPVDAPSEAKTIEVPLATLVSEMHSAALDERDNRLLVRRTPGDPLRVTIAGQSASQVFSPAQTIQLQLQPHLLGQADGSKIKFYFDLISSRDGESVWSHEAEATVEGGRLPAVPIELTLPAAEGIYDLSIQARVRTRLRLMQTVAERKLQCVVIEPTLAPAPLTSERSLQPLAEIDPVEPINPNWWNRMATLPNIPLIPNWRKGPLGSGDAVTWEHPQLHETLVQLGAGGREPAISWEAYPLPIERPGEPYVLEIDYPSDVPQSLGISIVEPNAAGTVLPIGLDSGVYLADEAAQSAPRWETHRIIFWPRTRSPLVLLTNRRHGSPAVFGKMRLLGGLPRLPRAFAREAVPERLWAGYLDRPLVAENFLGSESLDAWSGRSLDDWNTFYQGGTRLVDYLNHVGYNGLMLSAWADGSAIYPSALFESTPRYDTGVFFGTGQDLEQKDVLELMFRLFDREGLRLIPSLQFAAPLSELEELRRTGGPESTGVELIDASGQPWLAHHPARRGLAPHYNLLNPRVQQAMLRVCQEFVDRYRQHPAFAGLAIDLLADGYAHLPSADCGYDDATIAQFEQDHPGLRVPGNGATRFATRAQFLMGRERGVWIAWRARQVNQFYQRLNQIVAGADPDAKLYLAASEVFNGRQTRRQLRPTLPRSTQLDELLLELGISPALFEADGGPVLLRPNRIAPVTSLDARTVDEEVNLSAELDAAAQRSATAGTLFFHPPQEARLESFDAKGPFKKSYTWLVTQPSPSEAGNRQRFAHALATLDPQQMFDGGWLLPLGQEAALASLVAAYRNLPAQRLPVVADNQPVVLRAGTIGGRTCFYVVNDSPWKVSARLNVNLPAGCTFEPLDPSRNSLQLERDARGTLVRLELEPYDMLGGWFSAPRVATTALQVDLPADVAKGLQARLDDLSARTSALTYAQPLMELPKNQFFEEAPLPDGEIAGWSAAKYAGAFARLDVTEPLSGKHCVRLASAGPEAAWIRSEPIPPPATGRLAISVYLRVADTSSQPPLRLAVEWQSEGQIEYRYASLGQAVGAEVPQPIPSEWQQFVFLVTDLPFEGVSQLRARLDLMGPGEVWIDDVQLFDMVFRPLEHVALAKLISTNAERLREGKYADCQRFLDSYWPRFLAMHVPLVNDPAEAAAPRTAAGSGEAPLEEARKPGWLDRLKGIVPERFRF